MPDVGTIRVSAQPHHEPVARTGLRIRLPFLVGALALGIASACAPRNLGARADLLDARSGTNAYRWLVDHEPSSLDVSGVSRATVAPFDPQARVRDAGANLRTACEIAKRDAALLLIFAPASDAAARDAALDCGYALERDAAAVIVAPR